MIRNNRKKLCWIPHGIKFLSKHALVENNFIADHWRISWTLKRRWVRWFSCFVFGPLYSGAYSSILLGCRENEQPDPKGT